MKKRLWFLLVFVLIFSFSCHKDGPGAVGPTAPLPPNPNVSTNTLCTNNPCGNHGSCTPIGVSSFSCQCDAGYNGDLCDSGCDRPRSITAVLNSQGCNSIECRATFSGTGTNVEIWRWTFPEGKNATMFQTSGGSVTFRLPPLCPHSFDWFLDACCDFEGNICTELNGFIDFVDECVAS